MTSIQLKDWLKSQLNPPSITAGKLDTSKTQTICVYGGRTARGKLPALTESTYGEKYFRILVRWSNDFGPAEAKATEVYNLVGKNRVALETKSAWLYAIQNEPVSLGTDDKGIYEFSIDIKVIYER